MKHMHSRCQTWLLRPAARPQTNKHMKGWEAALFKQERIQHQSCFFAVVDLMCSAAGVVL